jgi:hypothetical protein
MTDEWPSPRMQAAFDQMDARIEERRAEEFRIAIEGPPEDWIPNTPEQLWQEHDLWCAVLRGPIGALCGYVLLPVGHPWWGLTYNQEVPGAQELDGEMPAEQAMDDYGVIPIFALGDPEGGRWRRLGYQAQVHGGLTFTGPLLIEGAPWGWWLGWDCAHAGDALDPAFVDPYMAPFNQHAIDRGDHVWTLDDVVLETGRLALSIHEARIRDDARS